MSEQPGTLARQTVPRWVWWTIGSLTCVLLLGCGLGLYAGKRKNGGKMVSVQNGVSSYLT